MKKIISLLVVALFAIASQAQSLQFNGADASACLRIYNGYTGTLSIVIQGTGGTQYVATVDGLDNTIAAKTNVALLAAAFAAATNRGGEKLSIADSSVSLAADSTVAMVLAGTYTAASGRWLTIPWDTSQCLHYDVAVPRGVAYDVNGRALVDPARPINAKFTVSKIYGVPTGTGSVTLSAYIDGTLAWQNSYTSPFYVLGAGGTNVSSEVITINEAVTLPVGSQSSLLIRASRATTATTGNLGAVFQPVGY